MAEKGHRIDPWDFKELIQIQDIEDLTNELSGKAPINHTHTTIEVNGLTGALDGKAAIVHGHAVADVVGLQAALDGKADNLHGHAVADVVGLQAALDGKADDLHGHAVADVVGLQAALDGKADDLHGHAVADVVGLQAALDGKADDLHGHAVADVVGLQDALNTKVDASAVGVADGVASLDVTGKVPVAQLPALPVSIPVTLVANKTKTDLTLENLSFPDYGEYLVLIQCYMESGSIARRTVSFAGIQVLNLNMNSGITGATATVHLFGNGISLTFSGAQPGTFRLLVWAIRTGDA
jgi:hypothetical protein